jgi:hypothetical protein
MRTSARWLAAPAIICVLVSCQAVSGLDQLRFAGSDAGAVKAAPACDGGASCDGQASLASTVCSADASCECPAASAAAGCEVVSQCGCERARHCQLRDGVPACVEVGAREIGSACESDSECGRGTACIDRLCAGYCASDTDCKSGRCVESALRTAGGASVRACKRGCDFATQQPCGQGAQCAHFGGDAELAGDYCVAPAATCAADGRCDEPAWGTRRCVAGSDAADCACTPRVPGASCDLIARCGCAPGSHCVLVDVQESRATLGCITDRAPSREPGAACNAEAECPAGYSCWRGLCEKYCVSAADCTGGDCMALRNPNAVSGVSVCSVACDFEADGGCALGTRCARAPDGQSYCLVPRAPCPFTNDGVCDEPQGTRVCAKGSDTADCS